MKLVLEYKCGRLDISCKVNLSGIRCQATLNVKTGKRLNVEIYMYNCIFGWFGSVVYMNAKKKINAMYLVLRKYLNSY